jgi:hypothetical protein
MEVIGHAVVFTRRLGADARAIRGQREVTALSAIGTGRK